MATLGQKQDRPPISRGPPDVKTQLLSSPWGRAALFKGIAGKGVLRVHFGGPRITGCRVLVSFHRRGRE